MNSQKKVLLVSNWDWVIYNFRYSLAESLKNEGYDIILVSPDGKYVQELRREFRWIEWPLKRRSINPLRELFSVWKLARIYERTSPDLIHHDTIKPNLYGALATRINMWRGIWRNPPQLVNSFMGIGFLFSDRAEAQWLRPVVLPIMKFAMRRDHVFTTFSNKADQQAFVRRGLIEPERSRTMVSEFVNTERFAPSKKARKEEKRLIILMAARLLWDKGVREFVSAAEILRDHEVDVEFWLAGEPDTEAPGFVPVQQLQDWNQSGVINWLGYCSDMPELLKKADIAVLPTHYNEGLPRFLVEAAATGLPLICSDLAACRRVVDDGTNGLLIPKRSPIKLAEAITRLVQNPPLRQSMGTASREKALEEFAERNVVKEWFKLYGRLLGSSKDK